MSQGKVVLLPGMHGTADLFADFIGVLPDRKQARVISYPNQALNLSELETVVRRALPVNEDFTLIAESFGGLIASRIAAAPPSGMKRLVLVASFLRPPVNPLTAFLAKYVSGLMLSHWLMCRAMGWIYAGYPLSDDWLKRWREVFSSVSPAVLQSRLALILNSNETLSLQSSRVPILYLEARHDRLVGKRGLSTILQMRPDTQCQTIDAPHFILQAAPLAAFTTMKKMGYLR